MLRNVKHLLEPTTLLFVASLSFCPSLSFADEALRVIPSAREVTVNGRGIATLVFNVSNNSGNAEQFIEQISLPEGWFLLSTTAPFLLPRGANELRLIHLSVPRGVASGTYPVHYVISARNKQNIRQNETIRVRIVGRSGVLLTRLETPANLLAGEPYKVHFQLKNTGNKRVNYHLSVDDFDGYVTKITPENIVLTSGEIAKITVTGQVEKALGRTDTHQFIFIAKGGGQTVEEQVSIPTVSRRPQGLGQYRKLYGNMKFSYSEQRSGKKTSSNEKKTTQAQISLNLQGSIDEKEKHYVSVNLRNGQRSNQSDNRQENYYQVGYATGSWKLNFGHNNFYAGRLSGNSLSGIGSVIDYKSPSIEGENSLTIRAFTGKSRAGFEERISSSGLVADYRFNSLQFEVGGSVLKYKEQGDTALQIATLHGTWNTEYFTLNAEIATDQTAFARFLDLTTQWKDIGLTLSQQHGDADFKGSYKDTEVNYIGINWAINDRNRINLGSRRSRNNLDEKVTQQILHSREDRVGLSHTFGEDRNIEITVGYRTTASKDLRETTLTNHEVTAQSIVYKQSFTNLDLQAKWEQGIRNDLFKKTKRSGQQQQLILRWKPTKEWDISTSYTTNESLDAKGNTTSANLRNSYRLDRRRNLSLSLQQTKNEATGIGSDNINLSYSHQFRNRHGLQLSLNSIKHSGSNDEQDYDDYSVRLEYVLPIGIPIRRRTNIGSLNGRVYFKDSKTPASNIILNLEGQYAVTDEKGIFSYPNILSKDYELSVDSTRLGGGGYMLGNEGASLNLTVEVDKTKQLNIGLKKAARLNGSLMLFKKNLVDARASSSSVKVGLVEEGGLTGILMELRAVGNNTNKHSIHRRITDQSGGFDFIGIPPGRWQLNIIDLQKIPKNFRAEKTTFQVNLVAGKEQNVQIRILPTQQTIQKQGPLTGFSVSG